MAVTHTPRDAERRGMDILYPDGSAQYNGFPDGTTCFYCGKVFEDGPVIEWRGSARPGYAPGSGHIFLHSECALNLCVRLMSDIHECQLLESHPTMKLVGHRHLEQRER